MTSEETFTNVEVQHFMTARVSVSSLFTGPVLATLLIPLLLCADQSVPLSEEARRTDPEVEAAFSAPPELGADLLITIARGAGGPRKERIEILISAFDMAGSAKYALRRVGATNAASGTDSDSGAVISALRPGLDKLSLQSRVIEELVLLEPITARRLFETSRHITIPNLSCNDALGYSFEDFYKTALTVIQRGYSGKEVAEGEPALLAGGLLRQVASPFQLQGAFQILLREEWKAGDLRSLVSAFASTLAHLSADDRSFTAGTNFSALQNLIQLDARLRVKDIDPFPLIQAFRGYLVRHLKSSRCADTVQSAAMSRFLDLFNQNLVSKVSNLSPISAEDRKPEKVLDAKGSVYEFWTTTESERLLNGLRVLRFGSRERVESRKQLNLTRPDRLAPYLTDAERSTVSWRVSLDAFLKEFHEWESRSDEPLLARFYEKCSILRGLIAIVPDSERKLALMRDLLTYIATAEIRLIDPPVWRLQMDLALDMPELSEIERNSLNEIAKLSSDVYVRTRASRPKHR